MRRRFGWHPLICTPLSEKYPVSVIRRYLDCVLPYDASFFLELYGYHMERRPVLSPGNRGFTNRKFCNFIYSNKHVAKRNIFCKKLMQYKRVDCPGQAFNNMSRLADNPLDKINFIANYRFTIAFENASKPWYISEKIFPALLAGSIPIYWGCPRIEQYINPNSFINCHNFDSLDAVIKEVIRVDNDPSLYETYFREPFILPGSRLITEKREAVEAFQQMAAALTTRNYRENKLINSIRLHMLVVRAAFVHVFSKTLLLVDRQIGKLEKWRYSR